MNELLFPGVVLAIIIAGAVGLRLFIHITIEHDKLDNKRTDGLVSLAKRLDSHTCRHNYTKFEYDLRSAWGLGGDGKAIIQLRTTATATCQCGHEVFVYGKDRADCDKQIAKLQGGCHK